MSYKYYEKMYTTRSGRRSLPTEKVQEILSESYAKAFEANLWDLQEMETNIRLHMAAKKAVEQIAEEFEYWKEHREQLFELVDTVREHIPSSLYKHFLAEISDLQGPMQILTTDVQHYFDTAPEGRTGTQVNQPRDEIDSETAKLEREVANLKKELDESLKALSMRVPKIETVAEKRTAARPSVRQGEQAYNLETQPPRNPPQHSSPREEEQEHVPRKQPPRKAERALKAEPDQSLVLDEPPPPNMVDRLLTMLEKKQDTAIPHHLPKAEPPVFAGEIMKFSTWWNAFETLVESKIESGGERLHYLYQYTKGEAQRVVTPYMNARDDPEAYLEARRDLFTRFGDQFRISEAYKAKLAAWGKIRDGDPGALQAFSDFLNQCKAAMKNLNGLEMLNSQEENIRLMQKLPNAMMSRWTLKVHKRMYPSKESQSLLNTSQDPIKYPSFQEFAEFVAEEAAIATGPYSVKKQEVRKPTTLHTHQREHQAQDRRKPRCSYCKGEHYLYLCEQFLSLPAHTKRKFARERGLCYGCLRRGHRVHECSIKNDSLGLMREEQDESRSATNMNTSTWTVKEGEATKPYTMVVPVSVFMGDNPEHQVQAYALLDTQSDSCFVADWLREELQVGGRPVQLDLNTMGREEVVQRTEVEGLVVRGLGQDTSVTLPECYSSPSIPLDRDTIPRPDVAQRWPHLREAAKEMMPPMNIRPGLLIGYNSTACFKPEPNGIRVANNADIYGWKTALGWTIVGHPKRKGTDHRKTYCYKTSVKPRYVEDFEKAFDIGFEEPQLAEAKMSREDVYFMNLMEKEARMTEEGKLELPLPMRELPEELPDSRPSALGAFRAIVKRMKRDPIYRKLYFDHMNALIRTGKAERAPPRKKGDKVWYWSHHGVENDNKPGVLRVVFNGSKKVQGIAINDYLIPGPDQLNSLVGVLLGFRKPKVPFTCDVEKMFWQVLVKHEEPECYRDYLRFFWYPNPESDLDEEPVEYRMRVHLFGASSSPRCANFALKTAARMYKDRFGEEAARFVEDHFYVDDGLGGLDGEEETVQLIKDSKNLCAAGGFNLCKFQSPNENVIQQLPEDWVAPTKKDLQPTEGQSPKERTLGVQIILKEDAITYDVKLQTKPSTRRGCLSTLSAIYDPLGLIAPALLPGRLILQELCNENLDWDDRLEADVDEVWQEWYRELQTLGDLRIKRCVQDGLEGEIVTKELHVFGDASRKGYGGCGYLRLKDDRKKEKVTLLVGKSRVAPKKKTTMPRLELQAAVLAVKLGNFLAEELKYEGLVIYYYSDSRVVLGYIFNVTRKFHLYVTNRTVYITSHSLLSQWRYVNTEVNPADLASRGLKPSELKEATLWWNGPPDLDALIARDPRKETLVLPNDPEEKKEVKTLCTFAEPKPLLLLIAEKYEKWEVAVEVLTYLHQIAYKARKEVKDRLQLKEEVETRLIKETQEYYLKYEIEKLVTPRENEKSKHQLRNSQLQGLDPFLDKEGIVRVGGRLNKSEVSDMDLQPRVIPKNSPAALQIAADAHQKMSHMSTNATLGEVRGQGFWIVHGRAIIGRLINKCNVCKRFNGRPEKQKMGELPQERCSPAPPFWNSASDVFGPYKVKIARATVKSWVCLFVCQVSRAVHLEMLESLDVSSFMLAFRRFSGRRGKIKTLASDCGTNYKAAESRMKSDERKDRKNKIHDELTRRGVSYTEFKFNPPKASHMGGSWERIIRIVRNVLNPMLLKLSGELTEELLRTMLVEAEAVVNSRPLSYVESTGPGDPGPLTPNMILQLRPAADSVIPLRFDENGYPRERWREVQAIADRFWDRWKKEVLQELNVRSKWQMARTNLKQGDVVLLVEESLARCDWPLGRVISVETGRDGAVRRVEVQSKGSTYRRPIHKLVKLY